VATPGKVDFIAVSPGWYHCFSIEDAIVASLNSVNAKFISQRCELGLLVGCDVTNVGVLTVNFGLSLGNFVLMEQNPLT
jgi:hypothetical protein